MKIITVAVMALTLTGAAYAANPAVPVKTSLNSYYKAHKLRDRITYAHCRGLPQGWGCRFKIVGYVPHTTACKRFRAALLHVKKWKFHSTTCPAK